MTLSPIHWVPVQDKGSKILCVKLGAMTITPSDPLHQEYLTINLGNTSDWWQLQLLLVRLCEMEGQELLTHSLCTGNAEARPVYCQLTFQTQYENSQDGLFLEVVSATMLGSAIFRMQRAEGCDWDWCTSLQCLIYKLYWPFKIPRCYNATTVWRTWAITY